MIKPSRPRGFILDEKLGSGAFAEVWLAHHESSQKNVAIKVVTKNSVRQSINKRRLENEIMIQSKINHPFIAPLYYSTENFLNYYLIMEYVPCGTLLSHIKSPCFLSNDTARKYFCQLLLAIYYLHNEMHVVHRDIKAENVLIDENDNIRLIDFGFSGDLNDDKSDVTLMKRCGSPKYLAPEVYDEIHDTFTEVVDMWSLGVLLYMLIKRKFPFKGETIPVLREKIKHKDPDYTDIEPSILPLLKGLLCKDPKNRFTSQQALNFPWVKTYIETSNLKIDIKIDNKNGITSNGNNILLNTIMTENFEEKILKREQMSAVTSEKPMKIRSSGSDIEFVTPVKQTVCEQLLATGKFRPIQAKHRRQDSLSKLMARYHKRSESLATGEVTEIMDNTVNNPNESF